MAEVHFCSLCDRSVPLAEVQDGSSARVGDRLLCPDCLDLLAKADSKGGGGGALGVLALVAALLGWAAVAVLWFRIGDTGEDLGTKIDGARGDLSGQIQDSAEVAAVAVQQSGEDLALAREDLRALRESHDALRSSTDLGLEELRASLAGMAPLAAEQDKLAQRFGTFEATLSLVDDRQRASRSNQEALRDRLKRLEDMTAALAAAAPKTDENAFSAEISALLRKLQDEDPEVRYGALEKLSAMQDERLLPHLYPLLADPYEFTRFLAAHTFSEWDARPAVPHLVEALLDEVTFVREAAVRALRRITGQSFGYQHEGDGAPAKAERQAAYQLWKTWWQANGAEFLKG
ncbi:MAG: HEAT repeat domain-containing protein [Planctomycetes bacterium]|nr:HEAT repeat domain-containing protein [Planctomycetota bacterium]MBL7008357.1 HEAT repeat domain-containing protein [Planctomycetota bacterium]